MTCPRFLKRDVIGYSDQEVNIEKNIQQVFNHLPVPKCCSHMQTRYFYVLPSSQSGFNVCLNNMAILHSRMWRHVASISLHK